jgi:dihydroceramidase
MFYAIFAHGKSRQISTLIGLLSAGIATFVTGYYLYIKDPVFHQNAFAILTIIVLLRSIYAMETSLRPSRKVRRGLRATANDAERVRMDRRDREILRTMWQKMMPLGVGSVLFGFLIWNLDNAFCSTLRSWRREIGLPWGILLEGHGWW